METQANETGERYNRPQGSFWNLCCLFIRGCRRKTEDAVAGKPLTITTTPVGSLVRGSLSNSVTGGSMRNPLSSDRTALKPKTNKHQWMSVLKRRRSMLSDNCINEFPSRENDTVSQLLTKAQITSPKTTTVTNNLKNHGSPSCLVRKDLKHGTFNVVSLEGEHLHESAVNKADPIGLITQAAVAAASRPSSNGEELPNGLHQKLPTTEECQLISYIELCERRVERLHNMISGLQKEKNALPTTLTQQVKKRVMSIIRPAETTTRSRDSLPQYRKEVAISLSEMEKVEQKMYRISERIRELKFQLESYAYLSWLGLTPETQQSRVAIPGRYAPMPNPQLHMIRRTDSECRMTIQEYNRLW
ncbi:unnamed protein product [Dicrocoelium dendriticum]|nr:unnamed protein product [Dicrocoelium dendriticum]